MNNVRINLSFNRYCNRIKAGAITLPWLKHNCKWTLSFFTRKQIERLERVQKKHYYKALTKRKAK